MAKNSFRTSFSTPRMNDLVKSDIDFKEVKSMVQPCYSYETDINNIVKTIVDKNGYQRSVLTGNISNINVNGQVAKYGDFTMFNADSYLDSLNLVSQAKSMFEQLPSNIRERFGNNPHNLIKFLNDDSNRDEAVKLGLVNEVIKQDVVDNFKGSDIVTPDGAT